MRTIFQNILVFVGAAMAGSFLNMTILTSGMKLITTPEGFDPDKLETYILLSPSNLMVPFAAHALGTLLAAFLVAKFAASNHKYMAFGMGMLFLMGGAAAAAMISAPMWFNIFDLTMAYFPMAFLGWVLAGKK